MPRIFVALGLADAMRAVAADAREALAANLPEAARLAWSHPDDLHLTLAFLGEVEPEGLERVCALVDRVAKALSPVSFEVEGVGAFPRAACARVVWLGIGSGHAALAQWAAALAAELRAAGHRIDDMEWTGHITLARVRDRAGLDVRAALARCAVMRVALRADALCVMESRPRTTGPHYATIFRASITGETRFHDV